MISYINTLKENFQKHPACCFWGGFFLGCLIFLLLYGPQTLDVTNTTWLLHSKDLEGIWDLTQHYLGWVCYRNSPWQFPLGLLEGLSTDPISIFYTDSIPLFAFLFKLLSPLLPATFQYFGLFTFLSYGLMGGFSALLLKKLTGDSAFSLIGCCFFILAPAMIKRTFYHTALSAHFLIPAGLALWAYKKDLSFASYRLLWAILATTATLINPYFTPMVLGILLCAILQDLAERFFSRNEKKHEKRKPVISVVLNHLADFLASVITLVAAAYVFGLFYGPVDPAGSGVEKISFNLLSFFQSENYLLYIENYRYLWASQNYSRFLRTDWFYSCWQTEGFAYLGLGLIVLLLTLCLFTILSLVWRKIISRNKQACKALSPHQKSLLISWSVYGLCFLFLALSPKATAGESVLYHIRYPDVILRLLATFRSTGRLIWPVYYGVITLLLLGFYRLCLPRLKRLSVRRTFPTPRNVLSLALLALLLLQAVDLSPALSDKGQTYRQLSDEDDTCLEGPLWEMLGRHCSRIMVCPPTNLGVYCDPETSCILVKYCLEHNMKINISYLSREIWKTEDARTMQHLENREQGLRDDSILYVFFPYSPFPCPEDAGLNYYKIEDYIIGTELDLSPYPDAVPYQPDCSGSN